MIVALVCAAALALDGDTFHCMPTGGDPVRVRIHALHAPEPAEPGGPAAAAELARLLAAPVACTVVDRDRYGRSVADCTAADGRDLAAAMIASGRARHCPRFGRADLAGTPANGLTLPAYCRKK